MKILFLFLYYSGSQPFLLLVPLLQVRIFFVPPKNSGGILQIYIAELYWFYWSIKRETCIYTKLQKSHKEINCQKS